MYACGSSSCGQLGLRLNEDVSCWKFTKIPLFDKSDIISVHSGREHTLVLFRGKDSDSPSLFSFGGNDLGELGRKVSSGCTKPSPVDFSQCDKLAVASCAAGMSHNLVCCEDGSLFAWGSNTDHQTSLECSEGNEDQVFDLPCLVKFPEKLKVRAVSAGSKHSVVLTSLGKVYVWGSNSYGQLGLARGVEGMKQPFALQGIDGLPVCKVECGSFHTVVITVAGRVFVCGRNSCGQLGLDDTNDKFILTRQTSLKPYFVLKAACGEQHTVFLCSDLTNPQSETSMTSFLLSCGNTANGQLGFTSESSVLEPRRVNWPHADRVCDVSCGRKHTLCLTEKGKVFACGINNLGQLGLGHCSDVFEFTQVQSLAGPVGAIATGGDQSFCILRESYSLAQKPFPLDRIDSILASSFVRAPSDFIKEFGHENFATLLKNTFENSACLNASFLHVYPSKFCQSSPTESAVDLEVAVAFLNCLSEMYNTNLNRILQNAIEAVILTLNKPPPDIECLRLYLILSQCYIFESPSNWQSVIIPFAVSLLKLNISALKTLKYWLKGSDSRYLAKLLSVYKEQIKYFVQNSVKVGQDTFQNEHMVKGLMICLRMLEFIHSVNEMRPVQDQLPANRFYVKELTNKLDIENDYIVWLQKKTSAQNSKTTTITQMNDPFKVVPVCDFPFVFDVASKSALLACEAMVKMQRVVTELQLRSILSSDFTGLACPFLVLCINRNNLVDSTLNQLFACDDFDLRKPLKVVFEGEDAVDAGGVKKEFFMLVLREILDVKYGMFKVVGNSKWFNDIIDDELRLFRMIGMICGLAIYNHTIIDLMFPMVLYKKLLSRPVGLSDLFSLDPDLAQQLTNLLAYTEDDVEDVFCLNFQVVKDFYGCTVVHDLIPNGGEISVTQENKQKYVDMYVDYLLNESVRKQYYEFSTGFFKVVKSDVFTFFQPEELHELISGSQNYDFYELEASTTYKGEFSADHPVIRNFWTVIHEMSAEMKLKFLLFLTGTERVPVNGMKSLQFTIQPTHGGEDYLPVAHTCFNLLDLPLYRDIDTLRSKLILAIEQTEGFALV